MGRDKAWLKLGGKPIVEHLLVALRPITATVAIIANSGDYSGLGVPVFHDTNTGVGPLEAIRTALCNSPTQDLILVGCDLPFLTSTLFECLLDRLAGHEAVVPIGPDGRLEPLCAAYTTAALDVATRLINRGERRITSLFDQVNTRYVPFVEISRLPGADLFFLNVNTPDDYQRALTAFDERPELIR